MIQRTKKKTHKELEALAARARRHIVAMHYDSQTGESGSALCIADLLVTLYFNILDIDPKRPEHPERDRFILSKGHGAAALYAAMALRGYFPESDLKRYRVDGGKFHCHPCRDAAAGIEVSTGSLGHGLSIALGMAKSMRMECSSKKVFILVGDGECNEGSIWEAALFASTHKLSNAIVILDNNKFQGFGASKEVLTMNLARKWSAFGWNVLRIDGHSIPEIERSLREAKDETTRPTIVIADTIAGKGVPHIENTLGAHYYIPDEATYLASLNA
ncbi:MAG TPA: transketolase [Candidatus Paceibacterota bacterium]